MIAKKNRKSFEGTDAFRKYEIFSGISSMGNRENEKS